MQRSRGKKEPTPSAEKVKSLRQIEARLVDALSIRRLPLRRPNRCQPVARNLSRTCPRTVTNLVEASKLADAPDLGLRNRRFQNVPFRFKREPIYEGKTRFSTIRAASTTDLIGRSGTGACRVTAFAIELFDCQFQKRFRQATDS
jgi:hypothetical protein